MKTQPPRPYKKPQPAHGLTRLTPHQKHNPEQVRKLPADHVAIKNNTTVYPSTIVKAADSPRLLVSGMNSRKIGVRALRGRWLNMPIYTLTLVERATCPTNCSNWDSCYGNNMHFARRHEPGFGLTSGLSRELKALANAHQDGFIVRLHVLGDFYDTRYADFWRAMLVLHKELRVFGYTAHHSLSDIGVRIDNMNREFPDRCTIRFSAGVEPDPSADLTAHTLWQLPDETYPKEADRILCPQAVDKTACCATCGLCWNPQIKDVAFIGHGQKTGERAPKKAALV